MTSYEYLSKLSHYLRKLPQEERDEALRYYNEYFQEAGPGREAEIIESLGSPKQLAQTIRSEAAIRQMNEGKPRIKKGMSAVWVTILGIFAAPIALPIAIAIFAVVFALLIAVFAVLFSLLVTALALALSGVAMFVISFPLLFQSAPTGLFYMGSGLFLVGFGLTMGLGIYMLTRVTLTGLARMFSRMFGRRKKSAGSGNASAEPPYGAAPAPSPKAREPRSAGRRVILTISAVAFAAGLVIGIIGFVMGGMQSVNLWPGGIKTISSTSQGEMVKVDKAFDPGQVSSIKIDFSSMGNVTITRGDKLSVTGQNMRSDGGIMAEEANGVLTVGDSEKRSLWSGVLNLGWARPEDRCYAVITVPADMQLDGLDAVSNSGNIKIDGLTSREVNVDVSSGRLDIAGLTSDTISIANDSGSVKLSSISAGALSVDVRSGRLTGDELNIGKLEISADSGAVNIAGVFAGPGRIECSSGTINVSGHIGGDFNISADSGRVVLNLDNARANTSLDLTADSGRVKVDGHAFGNSMTEILNTPDKLTVRASSGSIIIDFRG